MQEKIVYLVVGVPAAGKSWVCEQLSHKFDYIRHDDYMNTKHYVDAIERLAFDTEKPVLIETPFSMSQIVEPLERFGFTVKPFFIIEDEHTLVDRYAPRGTGPYPEGHITRQNTYYKRAFSGGHPWGTSSEILSKLQEV